MKVADKLGVVTAAKKQNKNGKAIGREQEKKRLNNWQVWNVFLV